MLLVASYVFYGAWDWRYLSLLLISTTVDYFCGIYLKRTASKKYKKGIVSVSIATNLTLLGVFKYYDFFIENFQILLASFDVSVQPYFLNLALPIGISFYTFQTMSYTIDVYRGRLKPAENYLDFALYVSFFPQLVAGPIERGTRLIPQILQPRTVTWDKFCKGVYFFYWGLFLKSFIADNLAELVDPVYNSVGPYNGAEVLLATYAFSFQIYCDFAGYSFMAIGLALAMGIELMENFRRPYFSKNISEFWRRWHISLSSWFRDYLFTPFYIYLGKIKYLKKYSLKTKHIVAFMTALLITEYLLGLWHGAGWNFGFFGIYHAVMIGVYYMIRSYWDKMNVFVQIFLSYQLACVGWLIFRASSLGQAWEMLKSVGLNLNLTHFFDLKDSIISFLALTSILITIQIFQDLKNDTLIALKLPRLLRYAYYSMLGSLILVFGNFGEKPFIYFQF
jgi:alginate O-acetyltransferase complex protein AlgI